MNASPFPCPVCRTPEEYAFLSAILATPADFLLKQVYADWLTERTDSRGEFLREWLEARSSGHPIPVPVNISPEWLSVIGFTLDEALLKIGTSWSDAIRQTAKPGLFVRTTCSASDLPRCGGRVGGFPVLHPSAEWPSTAAGAMTFLAQWNLADLAASPVCRELPPSGLLSIFADLSSDCTLVPDCRVIYSPSTEELIRRKQTTSGLAECEVEFVEWLTLPAPFAPALDRFGLSQKDHESYAEFRKHYPQPEGAVHQILGHASPNQISLRSGNEADYVVLSEFGEDPQAGLGSSSGSRWCVMIRSDRLAVRDFDEAHLEVW
jgi:uncharacterized protein (TIGR02996 family)